MQGIKPREVHIAAIHHIHRPGFGNQHVERMHVVQLAVRDMNEAGNIAAQIQQRVHLYRRFGGTEQRPGKQRQAPIDGGRIQRINRFREIHLQTVRRIELPRLRDQPSRKCRPDAPVP